jgi:hypothetical protein
MEPPRPRPGAAAFSGFSAALPYSQTRWPHVDWVLI